MNMFFFSSSLPTNLKVEYYKSIIKNGTVDDQLWSKIISYIEKNYKQALNIEEAVLEILKNLDSNEKLNLLDIMKTNNEELFQKFTSKMINFEDIIKVDKLIVKNVLDTFSKESILKASVAVSPKVIEYLQEILPEFNFEEERKKVGSLPMTEVIDIHNKIIKEINSNI